MLPAEWVKDRVRVRGCEVRVAPRRSRIRQDTPVTCLSEHAVMRSGLLILMTMIVAGSICLTGQGRGAAGAQAPGGGAVTGFVRYASGQEIADVRVSLLVPGDRSARTTRTANDGSYRFDAIPAGEYQISVSHAGAVAKRISIRAGSELKEADFSIPDGGDRRVVTGRVVMNAASTGQPIPARIGVIGVGVGVGVVRTDGTLVLPLAPGDQRVVVRLPSDYFLDSVTLGSANLYPIDGDGRRLSSAAFSLTVRPEPQTMPELVITLDVLKGQSPCE
jgi:hypothetical protein